jgi:protein-S-isoprenylcysteine O-methyltransferase Ste14
MMQSAISEKQQMAARAIMRSAVLSGRLSLLAIVFFIFSGPFNLIEMSLRSSGWLAWDAFLSFLFFLQHSGMIRRSFRARMARRIPAGYHGAIFTLASSLVLVLVVVLWQSSGLTLIELRGPLRWLARAVFFAAAAGVGWGYWALQSFDPYGVGPIEEQLSGTPLQTQPLTIRGPYLYTRHPLYFFVLVMMWACPDLTADRLLFNLLWTVWIFAGAAFEEKDLLAEFGDGYRKYQKKVPMLIPWKGLTPMLHKKDGKGF